MKKIIENKYFKGTIFILSAIIVALILSLFIKNNGQKYETSGSTIIENQKDALIIGNSSIEDLSSELESTKPNTIINELPITSTEDKKGSNSYGNINTTIPILKEDSNKKDSSTKNPTSENRNQTTTSKENTPIEITEEALTKIEETGISQTDLYFLRDIVFISDEIVSDYTETLSFALDGNFSKGKLNIENLEKDLEKLDKLEVEDATLKEVKTSLMKGTEKYIEGFNDYFDYGDNSTNLFKKADEHFYAAQSTLQIFLETYH